MTWLLLAPGFYCYTKMCHYAMLCLFVRSKTVCPDAEMYKTTLLMAFQFPKKLTYFLALSCLAAVRKPALSFPESFPGSRC